MAETARWGWRCASIVGRTREDEEGGAICTRPPGLGEPRGPEDWIEWGSGGDKLGGVPCWTQDADWPADGNGARMRLVFQVDMDGLARCLFAGEGIGHVFVSPTDPDRMVFKWQCG